MEKDLFLEILPSIGTGLTLGFIIHAILRASQKPLEGNQMSEIIVRPNVIYKYLAGACILFAIVISILPFIIDSSSNDIIYAPISGLFMCIIGAYLYFYVKNVAVIANQHLIISTNIRRKVTAMNWSDVSKVSFNKISQYLSLSDSNNTTKIFIQNTGFADILALLKSKTPQSIHKDALRKIDEFYKAQGHNSGIDL